MSSKSRIKRRVRRTVLFQPEHPLQLAVQSLLPPKKWSDVEVGALSTFINRERGGKVRVACKDMEFWDRAAAFVQQQAKTEHRYIQFRAILKRTVLLRYITNFHLGRRHFLLRTEIIIYDIDCVLNRHVLPPLDLPIEWFVNTFLQVTVVLILSKNKKTHPDMIFHYYSKEPSSHSAGVTYVEITK